MEAIASAIRDLAAEVEGNKYLCVDKDRHAALHAALDAIESALDSGHVRCGDCNERMSCAEVAFHECRGRFCRVQCGDCGEYVDGDRVNDHVCSSRRVGTLQAPPPQPRGKRWAPALSDTRVRGRGPPYLLADVHARLELLCLELDTVSGSALPWWELTTPDAHEALTTAVLEVRTVLDEQFIKCGDCGEMMSADDILAHVCSCHPEGRQLQQPGAAAAAAFAAAMCGPACVACGPASSTPTHGRSVSVPASPLGSKRRREDVGGAAEVRFASAEQASASASVCGAASPPRAAPHHRRASSEPLPQRELERLLHVPAAAPAAPTAPAAPAAPAAAPAPLIAPLAPAEPVADAQAAAVPTGGDAPMVDAKPEAAPRRRTWKADEDAAICRLVAAHGLDFETIAASLPGRTADGVRNRWGRLRGSNKLPEELRGNQYRCAQCGELKRGHTCKFSGGLGAWREPPGSDAGSETGSEAGWERERPKPARSRARPRASGRGASGGAKRGGGGRALQPGDMNVDAPPVEASDSMGSELWMGLDPEECAAVYAEGLLASAMVCDDDSWGGSPGGGGGGGGGGISPQPQTSGAHALECDLINMHDLELESLVWTPSPDD